VRDKARFRRTTIGVLLLQMWLVCQALALDPRATSYLRTDFTVEEGLPDNEANAITQTRNGGDLCPGSGTRPCARYQGCSHRKPQNQQCQARPSIGKRAKKPFAYSTPKQMLRTLQSKW
jgi:hypothetical protein